MSFLCPRCTDRLISYGTDCYKVMNTVAIATFQGGWILYTPRKSPFDDRSITFLEKKGYIITTEIDRHNLAILPNLDHCDCDVEEMLFCWCEECPDWPLMELDDYVI